MKHLAIVERSCLVGHVAAMAFGLGGLLFVLPRPDFIVSLSDVGQTLFRWGMTCGGATYMILGAIAAAVYAYRVLGLKRCLTFMLPAVFLSLGSELLGTSTGFPFGYYGYLDGLGYKIAGLVPFTIPLSWFYLGFSTYVLARVGLESVAKTAPNWLRQIGAIAIGAVLLTAWDIVLDFAMSQDSIRFWEWRQAGAFYGMPYQNFVGWLGTGALFMSVAALFWGRDPLPLRRSDLTLPLGIYLVNFTFGATITLFAGIWVPCILATLFGLLPTLLLWRIAQPQPSQPSVVSLPTLSATQQTHMQPIHSAVTPTTSAATDLPAVPLSGE
jgi:putative membrane protein